MDEKELEKYQQWDTVMTLMGFSRQDMWDNYYTGNDTDIMETVEDLIALEKRKNNPSDINYKAAITTIDMGITPKGAIEYFEYMDRLDEIRKEQERNGRILADPVIKKLIDVYKFEFVQSSRFVHCKNFIFQMKDGTIVNGRIAHRSGDNITITWKNGKGKTCSEKWKDYQINNLPKTFPDEMHSSYKTGGWFYVATDENLTWLSYAIAYWLINGGCTEYGWNFPTPKK